MKKITFLILAAFMCSMVFGQIIPRQPIEFDNPISEEMRTDWYGNPGANTLFLAEANDVYAVAFNMLENGVDAIEPDINKITKIRWFAYRHTQYPTYNGNSFTLKIYENLDLSGTFDASAEPAYSQTFTANTDGNVTDITLTTPYTVPAHQFVVTIVCNAKSIIGLGQQYADIDVYGGPYSYYVYEGNWRESYFRSNSNPNAPPYFCPITLAVYADDGTAYIPKVDLEADIKDGGGEEWATSLQALDIMALEFFPAIINNGPDDLVGIVSIYVQINGEDVEFMLDEEMYPGVYFEWPNSQSASLQNGYYTTPIDYFSILPETLDALGIIPTPTTPTVDFTLTVIIEYEGDLIELNESNNSKTIPCKRIGATSVADISALATFKVYPNPSKGIINVYVEQSSIINVYDITGKLVNNANVNAGEKYSFSQVPGMYFVNVNGSVQKVIIE